MKNGCFVVWFFGFVFAFYGFAFFFYLDLTPSVRRGELGEWNDLNLLNARRDWCILMCESKSSNISSNWPLWNSKTFEVSYFQDNNNFGLRVIAGELLIFKFSFWRVGRKGWNKSKEDNTLLFFFTENRNNSCWIPTCQSIQTYAIESELVVQYTVY